MTSTAGTPAPWLVTGSKRGDAILFLALACAIVLGGTRLRAYYRVTVAVIDVACVAADGTRRAVTTPESFRRAGSSVRPVHTIPVLERRIRAYAREHPGGQRSDARLEWMIRYSFNSTALDRRHVVLTEGDCGP